MKTPQNVVIVARGRSFALIGTHDDSTDGRLKLLYLIDILRERRAISHRTFTIAAAKLFRRRTTADKRASIASMLVDPLMSDSAISRCCAVSRSFVAGVRKTMPPSETKTRKYTRAGKTRSMTVGNIGRNTKAAQVKRAITTGSYDESVICSAKVIDRVSCDMAKG